MSPLAASTHQRQVPLRRLRFAMVSDDSNTHDDNDVDKDDDTMSASAQDLRSFVTQRCIQSFMFLLASTRDLHTVWWLDNFIQPITINNYDWDLDDEDAKPVSLFCLQLYQLKRDKILIQILLLLSTFRDLKILSVKMTKG